LWIKIEAAVLVRSFDAGDDAQQRGLAGAGRAEQRHQFAGFDFEAHPASGDDQRSADVN
jgi:hypothetical protein